MDSYIVSLEDISEEVCVLSRRLRLTHIFPFVSKAVFEGDSSDLGGYAASAVKVAVVTAAMDRARSAVHCPAYPPEPFAGAGVTVAVIDTGVEPHVDILVPNRLKAFVDLVDGKPYPYDDNGHGTAVTGALAGNGLLSGGKYAGVASGADIVVIKALDADGEGSTADILRAMQWVWSNAEAYGIRVVCMSFGALPQPRNDPLAAGVRALHAKGITSVVSAGNGGPEAGTVMSPGVSPYAITVGGAGISSDGVAAVSEFSSRGPSNGLMKPDILAPAENVTCISGRDHAVFSGTSIAAPIAAGACARMLADHPGYTPDRVKEELKKHASPIPGGPCSVGAGLLSVADR